MLLGDLSTRPRGCPALRDRHAPTVPKEVHIVQDRWELLTLAVYLPAGSYVFAPCAMPLGVIIAAYATARSYDYAPCMRPLEGIIAVYETASYDSEPCTRPLVIIYEIAGSYVYNIMLCMRPLGATSYIPDWRELRLRAVCETSGSYYSCLCDRWELRL